MAKTLHIFNPEHDIALAADLANFTAPHAGRQLRSDLGWLPVLWAGADDVVLVDNVEQAERAWRRVRYRVLSLVSGGFSQPVANPRFVQWSQLATLAGVERIQPWGWDKALCAALRRSGVGKSLLPDNAWLDDVRTLSHRRVAAQLLSQLRCEGTVGEAYECHTTEELDQLLGRYGRVVAKAPWSSSGRGVHFLSANNPQSAIYNWVHHVIARQGAVMVEPCYDKLMDFGMEFEAMADGTVRYLGLSLFHTANGAYIGNVLASESVKREVVSRYVSAGLLSAVQSEICRLLSAKFKGRYVGAFGVDMMVVSGSLLHPCVEINLRRTMGHVALSLTPADDEVRKVMRIAYDKSNYKLKINKL